MYTVQVAINWKYLSYSETQNKCKTQTHMETYNAVPPQQSGQMCVMMPIYTVKLSPLSDMVLHKHRAEGPSSRGQWLWLLLCWYASLSPSCQLPSCQLWNFMYWGFIWHVQLWFDSKIHLNITWNPLNSELNHPFYNDNFFFVQYKQTWYSSYPDVHVECCTHIQLTCLLSWLCLLYTSRCV